MRALLFLVSAVAAASGLVGALRWFLAARAGNWGETGDGLLFWLQWAGDPGGDRLLYAAALALALLLLAALLRRRPAGRWLGSLLRLGGHPFVALGLVLFALLPQGVTALLRPAPDPEAPSVVLVVLDSVRLDEMGWGGAEHPTTPHLDRLAEEGVAFTQAITQAPWTKPSAATLLTGLIPGRHLAIGRPSLGLYSALEGRHRTLAEAFLAAGWETCALSTNPNITARFGFRQGFQRFRDDAREDADWLLGEARAWLGERDRERPFFLYLHLNDTHYPYAAPEPWRGAFYDGPSQAVLDGSTEAEFRALDPDGGFLREFSAEDARQFRLSQMEELRAVDERLGPFLEEVFTGERPVIAVIVSDHGEEFLEHGDLGHGHQVYDELLRVPLQVAWNEEAGRRLGLRRGRWNTQVRLLDVAPTVLELCDLGWPERAAPLDGESLVPFLRDEADPQAHRPAWSETDHYGSLRSGPTGPLRTWRMPGEKIITTDPWVLEEAWKGRYWVFDLGADPEERRNLAGEKERRLRLLQAMEASGWLLPRPEPIPYRLLLTGGGAAAGGGEALSQMGYVDAAVDPSKPPVFAPGAVPWWPPWVPAGG